MLRTEADHKLIPTNFSPLDPIKWVFAGGPGVEAVVANIMPPELSLFEPEGGSRISVSTARGEHEGMLKTLEAEGIQTFNTRHILGQVLAERANHQFTSRDEFLQELRSRAYALFAEYRQQDQSFGLSFEHIVMDIEELLDLDIEEMGLDAAIALNGVLNNIIDVDGNEKPFNLEEPPVGNFMFWRDTMHITGDELVTHQMHYAIRQQEVALAQMALEFLGVPYRAIELPSNQILKPAGSYKIGSYQESIEGGDILPMQFNGSLYQLIGNAERTSWEAVKAWYAMHERLFSASGEGLIPMVVNGPRSGQQEQMHLDTFMQQVAPGVLIHCGEITRQREIRVLMRKGGEIVMVRPEDATNTMMDWIERTVHGDVYNMSKQEQLDYAPNVLVSGNQEGRSGRPTVFITRDGTPNVTAFIRQHANVVELCMNELTRLYGGAHCGTQESR